MLRQSTMASAQEPSLASASTISNVFSTEDIEYLTQHPDVIIAQEKLSKTNPCDKVYFTIPITDSIRNTLKNSLNLDVSNVSNIPMRWIKGDIAPHIDTGASKFENTYLVYMNDSEGNFILDTTSYPITSNTAFIFNEGILHKTENTGIIPRLLLGPMNEFAEPVGAPSTITYYDNYADAFANNANAIAYQFSTYILGDTSNINIINPSFNSYTLWRVGYIYGSPPPSGVYPNGFDLFTLGAGPYYMYPSAPCFLEGTQILASVNGEDKYVPIESLHKGDLVKTSRDGYKKVELIGHGEIQNPADNERIQNRLYKCSIANYQVLKEDLYITGCYSILVDNITDIQRQNTIKQLGKIFITDKKYRLMACIDERAEPYISEGKYTIWHFALEHVDEKMNYGVYANGGLLVETCSIYFLKNKSNMKF